MLCNNSGFHYCRYFHKFKEAMFTLIIAATVERFKPSNWSMFVAASPFSDRLIMSNVTSTGVSFLFFQTPPSEEVPVRLETKMEDNKFPQTQHKRKRSNAQQSNMASNQELSYTIFFTLAPYDDIFTGYSSTASFASCLRGKWHKSE